MTKKHYFSIFLLFLIGDLCALALDSRPLEYVCKPALMLTLSAYAYWQQPKAQRSNVLLGALMFSLLGDVFLMLKMLPMYFILGLGSFLVAHIFYIALFWRDNPRIVFGQRDRLPYVILILAYGVGLFGALLPHLGDLKIPVGVYTLVILGMLLTVLNRWRSVSTPSFALTLFGAVQFVLSDSMIAINKFAMPFVGASYAIMLLYALGQWLIVEGFLIKNKS